MHIIKFSYDDEDDAINSLSNYYNISKDVIHSKLPAINLIVKEKKDNNYDSGKYTYYIRLLLKANPEPKNIKLKVYYYHHCSSDGTREWFKEGLLNSTNGLNSFITKVQMLAPNLLSESIVKELEFRLIERIKAENIYHTNDVGIFAYSRLSEAMTTSTYDFPEIFSDLSDRLKSNFIKTELRKIIQPTVVKFYKEYGSEDIDCIVFDYWQLICQRFDEAVEHHSKDVGRGITIPFEQIEKIIPI